MYNIDIKEWTITKVEQYIKGCKQEPFPSLTDMDVAIECKESLANEEMLPKEQAKWLESYLQERLTRELNEKTIYGRRMEYIKLQDMELYMAYTTAWETYCRPGTYYI